MASVIDVYGKLLLDSAGFRQQVEKEGAAAGDAVSRTMGQKLSGGLRQSLSGLGGPIGIATSGFGKVRGAVAGLGGALGHAKSQLLGLLSGPLGLLGLSGGLLSIAGAFKEGVGKAQEFGGEVRRIMDLTGLSAQAASRLAGVFDHFGISADSVASVLGRVGKNLDAIIRSSSKGTDGTTKLAAAQDTVRKAEERLAVARLRLNEIQAKGTASASTLLAARNRVRDATSSLAMAEDKLTAAQKAGGAAIGGAAAFYKQYGLRVTDAKGQALDFYNLLLTTADYWANKGIPITTKIAALQKVYGKSWQDFLPVIKAGRQGIKDAADEAARLGLTLTGENLADLARLKVATRGWSDALGGLKLQIGLALLPVITDMANGLKVLVVENRDRIVKFVRDIAQGAETLARIFGETLWPILQSVFSLLESAGGGGGLSFATVLKESASFARDLGSVLNTFVTPAIKAIVGAWNALPDELRQLLIKGFIANKVIKWTFGFDAAGFGLNMAKTFVANVSGKLIATVAGESIVDGLAKVGIGKAFVQPVFVTNPGFGAAGAAGGAAEAAGGAAAARTLGMNFLSRLPLLIAGAVGLAVGHELAGIAAAQGPTATGLAGGLAGGALSGGGAAAILTALGVSGPIAVTLGALYAVTNQMFAEQEMNSKIAAGLQQTTNEYLAQSPTASDLEKSLAAVDQGIADITSNPLYTLVQGDALDKLRQMRTDIANQLANSNVGVIQGEHAGQTQAEALAETRATNTKLGTVADGVAGLQGSMAASADRIVHGVDAPLSAMSRALHADFREQLAILGRKGVTPEEVRAAADKVSNHITNGVGNLARTQAVLAQLERQRAAAAAAHNTRLVAALDRDIASVRAKIPGREYVQRQIAEARRIVAGTQSVARKQDQLRAIQAQLRARGDINASRIVGRLIVLTGAVRSLVPVLHSVASVIARSGSTRTQVRPGSKQAGGPVQPNVPYWTGEAGRELIVPQAPAVVLPNWFSRLLGRAVSPGGETNITHITVPVNGLVRAETPADIARPLRALASTGYIAPRRRLTTARSY